MADKKIEVMGADGKPMTLTQADNSVALAALGDQVKDVIQQMAQIQTAFKEQRGQATLDVEKLVAGYSTQIEALRAFVDDRLTIQRKGERQLAFGEDPLELRCNKGKFRGKRYSDLAFCSSLIEKAGAHVAAGGFSKSDYAPASEDLRKAVEEYRAYTSGGSGTGAEWVPSSDLAERVWMDQHIKADVVSHFPVMDEMPTDPFEWPLELDDTGDEWTGGIENIDVSSPDAATRESTMRSKELVNAKAWSKNFNEDSLLAVASAFEAYLVRTGREMMDKLFMNADKVTTATGNINLDDAAPGATKYYLVASNAQDGLRKQGIIDNTAMLVNAGGDALVINDINQALSKMGKYAVRPQDVRIFSEVATYLFGISGLAEVQTIDKFGPQATIVTGQIARVKGAPCVVTNAIGKTEADGKISATAGNNTLGQIVLTSVGSWVIGFKRGLEIEVEYRPLRRKLYMVSSFRMAIGSFGTRSTATHTSVIRNIFLS